MKRKVFVIGILIFALAIPLVAWADAIVTISEGPFTIDASAVVDFGAVAHSAEVIDLGPTDPASAWTVEDARGYMAEDNPGWRVMLTAGDFEDGLASIEVTSLTGALTIQMNDDGPDIVCESGESCSSMAKSEVLVATALDNAVPLRIIRRNPGLGDSSWSFIPHFALSIPAGQSPGGYTSVFTADLLSGPDGP